MKAVSLKRMSQSVNIISWSEYKISQMWRLTQADAWFKNKQLGMKTMVVWRNLRWDISNTTYYRNWIT
jgi:hypothetical protein